jgi:hypothetical protein
MSALSHDVRVTAAERESAQARLRHAVGEGALTLDEFSERIEQVLHATTRAQVEAVVADLPPLPAPRAPRRRGFRPPRRLLLGGALLAALSLSPQLPAGPDAVAVMGGTVVDVSAAEDDVVVDVVAVMGGVGVIVADGARVELDGLAIMGGQECRVCQPGDRGGDVPLVRVRGLALMGGIEVHDAASYAAEERDDD